MIFIRNTKLFFIFLFFSTPKSKSSIHLRFPLESQKILQEFFKAPIMPPPL